jgi:hypothetical protein
MGVNRDWLEEESSKGLTSLAIWPQLRRVTTGKAGGQGKVSSIFEWEEWMRLHSLIARV